MNNYTEVNVKVTGQALQLASVPLIASGGINSVKVIFTFDSLWDGMAKTAVFYTDPKQAVQVLLTDDWAVVPSEILGKDGTFSLGVFGTNEEQVLPSALVELSINKGAASLQPVDPAEPTPDIYSQIMSAYAVLKARMDALVTMKGIGAEYGTVSDEHVNGIFKSNGYSAFLNFTISGLSLAAGDRHYTDYFLSANRAPLSTVEMETSDPALKVTIEAPTAEGLSRVLIENISTTDYAADKFTIVTAFYPLANTGNTEVTDLRVGYDNTVYPTAAEAVRAQFSKIATDAAEQRMTHFMITYDEETDTWICSTPYIGLQNRLATHRLQSLVMVKGHTFCSVDRVESDPDDGVKALDLYTEWGVFRFSPDESIVKIAEPESGGGGGYIVKINKSYDEETGGEVYATDGFSWEELQEAVKAGKQVVCRITDLKSLVEDGMLITDDVPLSYYTEEENFAEFRRSSLWKVETYSVSADGNMQYAEVIIPTKNDLPMILDLRYSAHKEDGEIYDTYIVENNVTANQIIVAARSGVVVGRFKRGGYICLTDYARYADSNFSSYGGNEIYFPGVDFFYDSSVAACNRNGQVVFVNDII